MGEVPLILTPRNNTVILLAQEGIPLNKKEVPLVVFCTVPLVSTVAPITTVPLIVGLDIVGLVPYTFAPVPVVDVVPVPPEETAIGVVVVKVVNAPVLGVALPIGPGAENTLLTRLVKPLPETVSLSVPSTFNLIAEFEYLQNVVTPF